MSIKHTRLSFRTFLASFEVVDFSVREPDALCIDHLWSWSSSLSSSLVELSGFTAETGVLGYSKSFFCVDFAELRSGLRVVPAVSWGLSGSGHGCGAFSSAGSSCILTSPAECSVSLDSGPASAPLGRGGSSPDNSIACDSPGEKSIVANAVRTGDLLSSPALYAPLPAWSTNARLLAQQPLLAEDKAVNHCERQLCLRCTRYDIFNAFSYSVHENS